MDMCRFVGQLCWFILCGRGICYDTKMQDVLTRINQKRLGVVFWGYADTGRGGIWPGDCPLPAGFLRRYNGS